MVGEKITLDRGVFFHKIDCSDSNGADWALPFVALAEKRVNVLMGDAVEPRKNWIEENVEFSLEDSYKIA